MLRQLLRIDFKKATMDHEPTLADMRGSMQIVRGASVSLALLAHEVIKSLLSHASARSRMCATPFQKMCTQKVGYSKSVGLRVA